MKKIPFSELKVGDKKLIEKCGYWEVESVGVSKSGKFVTYTLKDLPGERKGKPERLTTIQ